MKAYTVKKDISSERAIVADDMILTTDMPTCAGSLMLDGYMSLLESEALTRLKAAGYSVSGKADVGEFAIDLLGETSYRSMITEDGKIKNAAAQIVASGESLAALCLDVNGSVRRAATQSGLVSVKPTYGTVSRYGTVPVACSGETVSVMACNSDTCAEILSKIVGHDDKDGTSLSNEDCDKILSNRSPARRIALISSMSTGIDADVKAKLDSAVDALKGQGIEVCVIELRLYVCIDSGAHRRYERNTAGRGSV